ncbi:MAG: hypothetical protein LBL74_08630 [Bacteroidales bacterium]|jgi:hypothetical protein|nr:hypothetical protein [Bacteroidales bacterium]
MANRIFLLLALITFSLTAFSQTENFEGGDELSQFFKDLKEDYNQSASQLKQFADLNVCMPYPDNPTKEWIERNTKIIKAKKRQCYWLVVKWLLQQGINSVIAPIAYTIWWRDKNEITDKIYKAALPLINSKDSLSVNEVFFWLNEQIEKGHYKAVCEKPLKSIGLFDYFIWTYSDILDPLGRGILPLDYKGGKNTFCNRFLYSAVRNPGSLQMHIYQRSDTIVNQVITKDTRIDEVAKSYGIGNQQLGTWLCWYVDNKGKLYFIYERSTQKKVFYCGFVRTYLDDEKGVATEQNRKRFEVSLRKNTAQNSQ